MKLASELSLNELNGKKIRSLKDFSGVPFGTTGTVIDAPPFDKLGHSSVRIQWDLPAKPGSWRESHQLNEFPSRFPA